MPEDARPPLVVLHFWWTQGSTARQETYGPWPADDEGAHLEQVSNFIRDWQRATGITPSLVTMALVQDPAASLAELAGERERR